MVYLKMSAISEIKIAIKGRMILFIFSAIILSLLFILLGFSTENKYGLINSFIMINASKIVKESKNAYNIICHV